jgi:hypothetical protein
LEEIVADVVGAVMGSRSESEALLMDGLLFVGLLFSVVVCFFLFQLFIGNLLASLIMLLWWVSETVHRVKGLSCLLFILSTIVIIVKLPKWTPTL